MSFKSLFYFVVVVTKWVSVFINLKKFEILFTDGNEMRFFFIFPERISANEKGTNVIVALVCLRMCMCCATIFERKAKSKSTKSWSKIFAAQMKLYYFSHKWTKKICRAKWLSAQSSLIGQISVKWMKNKFAKIYFFRLNTSHPSLIYKQ